MEDTWDSEREWKSICENFAKLDFLDKLIKKYTPDYPKFLKSMNDFLEELDVKTHYYLVEIYWDDSSLEYYDDFYEVKCLFRKSLVDQEPFVKIETLFDAYSVIVQIVEEIRKECVSMEIDPEFKKQFRRRKI
jgi:hypothetical protein